MRIVVALFGLVALTCATQTTAPACIDLSGTYVLAGPPVRNGTGSATFMFGESASLKKIDTLTIEQPGCRIELHATGEGGESHDAVLEDNLDWTDDGVSVTWTQKRIGSNILAGASSRSRTLTMRLSPQRDMLTVSSEFDERGLALLFMPFHDHGAATCVMKRASGALVGKREKISQ